PARSAMPSASRTMISTCLVSAALRVFIEASRSRNPPAATSAAAAFPRRPALSALARSVEPTTPGLSLSGAVLISARMGATSTTRHRAVSLVCRAVRGVGREVRIHDGGLEADDGPGGLVERVNDVMNGAGMVAVPAKDTKRDGAGLEVDSSALLAAPCGAHQRKRMKRRRLIIVRKPFRQHAHRARVSL